MTFKERMIKKESLIESVLENINEAVSNPDFLTGCIIPIKDTEWKIGKFEDEFVIYHKIKVGTKFFRDKLEYVADFIVIAQIMLDE